jgi:hypothetical protein
LKITYRTRLFMRLGAKREVLLWRLLFRFQMNQILLFYLEESNVWQGTAATRNSLENWRRG